MLEIRKNNISLDISEDIQLNLVIENPFMVADRIPVPFSFDFELPPTPKNLKEFGYPNRVTSFKISETPIKIIFDGVQISSGILTFKSFDVTIKVNFKGVSVFDSLTQKLFDVEMAKYEFGVVNKVFVTKNVWNPNRNDPNNFAGKYRSLHNNSLYFNNFVLAPVRVPGSDWTVVNKKFKPPGFFSEFDVNVVLPTNTADRLYLNFYNTRDNEFNITSNYNIANLPAYNSSPLYNTRAFPFPYVGYVFDVCFDQLLTSNPFSQGELAKLIMIAPYHPRYKEITGFFEDDPMEGMIFDNAPDGTDSFSPFYKLNSFMPDMTVNEFLREVLKLFCMSLYPDGDKFKIVKNSDILNNYEVENWTALKNGKLKHDIKKKLFYEYGYGNIEETTVTVPEGNVLNSVKDLINKNVPASSNFIADYKISTTGEFYTKEMDGARNIYTRLNTGYGKSKETSTEKFESGSAVGPLPMSINQYWVEKNPTINGGYPAVEDWYVPEFAGDRLVRQTSPNIMFYRGVKPTFAQNRNYPLLTASNYDHEGNRLGDISLGWEGADGLLNKFHKEFKAWIEKDKIKVSGEFRLNAVHLKMLNLATKKHIDGRLFFIERLQVTITKDKINPANIDFIEA